jgi:hypothetical protein
MYIQNAFFICVYLYSHSWKIVLVAINKTSKQMYWNEIDTCKIYKLQSQSLRSKESLFVADFCVTTQSNCLFISDGKPLPRMLFLTA